MNTKERIVRLAGMCGQVAGRMSFRTGVIVGVLSVVCYALSFGQMLLPFSITVKGVLWIVFFGLAKTFQYTALLILGKAGVGRLRALLPSRRCRARSDG